MVEVGPLTPIFKLVYVLDLMIMMMTLTIMLMIMMSEDDAQKTKRSFVFTLYLRSHGWDKPTIVNPMDPQKTIAGQSPLSPIFPQTALALEGFLLGFL